ncbi:anti-sigma factor antagonist [Adhaeribacter aerolatus]|uniref:Anti-sigma factor antagonist n=1 Tax=Adhaeribacter aerolatus TaxID=670289 RepID=A0A512AY62_9BACT|nr:STAS domain-containing protein [Adhaeribacter aerolatus]GEO04630.1 anti-sigma factor antagonist [Adhaeribacter aerolatus]
MKILTRKNGESYIIKLCGELDASTAEPVEKVLDEIVLTEPAQIQIDCKELKYISSRGLGVFISRFQEIKDKQIDFYLFNMSEPILYVFRVLGLEELMDLRAENTVKT